MPTLPDFLKAKLDVAIQAHRLPSSFWTSLEQGILPCAAHIAQSVRAKPGDDALIWGVNGAQGTGKSTLVHFLALILKESYGLRVVTLSIDDFYLSKADRQAMAARVHPLFATRGVPGTHQVDLGCQTLIKLKKLQPGETLPLPAFDKAQDDCVPSSQWKSVTGPVDVVLFEGWCVGCQPQPDEALRAPVNALEADEDAKGRWRDYVNQQLRVVYPAWFNLLDALVVLKSPGFEQVAEWRGLQEQKLHEQVKAAGKPVPATLMSAAQIKRFIQHYERLTRWSLETLPPISEVVLDLQKDHTIRQCHIASR